MFYEIKHMVQWGNLPPNFVSFCEKVFSMEIYCFLHPSKCPEFTFEIDCFKPKNRFYLTGETKIKLLVPFILLWMFNFRATQKWRHSKLPFQPHLCLENHPKFVNLKKKLDDVIYKYPCKIFMNNIFAPCSMVLG